MTAGLAPIPGDQADAEQDDVASRSIGEDMAVEGVDDGVEQASGGGEQRGTDEGVGLGGRRDLGHGSVVSGFLKVWTSAMGCENIAGNETRSG